MGVNDEVGRWQLVLEGGFPRRKVSLGLDVLNDEERSLSLKIRFT